jgi:hypothetical protein
MKYISRILLLSSLIITTIWGCKKDENQIYYTQGTNPVLSASKANNSNFALAFVDASTEAIKLNWTNPNYQFTTGLSSQDVSYTVEIDTVGSNFTNPNKKTFTISKDLSKSILVSELNDYMLNQLVLKPGVSHNLEIRVKSDLVSNAANATLISNSLKFGVTPYAIPPKVDLPTSDELYITGSATPLSWQCGCAGDLSTNYATTQKFSKVGPAQYELASIALNGGQSYLLLPVYGSWSDKFGYTGGNNANNVDGDDFKRGGGDIKAPAASGNYKIRVDFQIGKFTVTKL